MQPYWPKQSPYEPRPATPVRRNFEVIGEASHNIETHHPQFAEQHPQLPLAIAYQMRNAVAHGYFKVDLELVWKTIGRDLPRLYQQVCDLLKEHPSAP